MKHAAVIIALAAMVFSPIVPADLASAQLARYDALQLKLDQWRSKVAIDQPIPESPSFQTSEFNASADLSTLFADSVANNTRVVFQSFRDGNWEIYRSNGDMTDVQRLTVNTSSDVRPRLSFNGQRIAFTSNRDGNYEIYTVNWDGSDLKRVTYSAANEGYPAWSPDGTEIAFVSDLSGNLDIFTMKVEGSNWRRLTTNALDDYAPAWSLDGTRLTWARVTNVNTGDSALMILALDSGTERSAGYFKYLGAPMWADQSNEILVDADVTSDGWNDLVLLTPTGDYYSSHIVLSSRQPLRDYWAGVVSPNAQSALFVQVDYSVQNDLLKIDDQRLLTIKLDGSGLKEMQQHTWNSAPDWRWDDTLAPSASVFAPSMYVRAMNALARWSGVDSGPAGVGLFDVQYRVNGGAWQDWLVKTTTREGRIVNGLPGDIIEWRCRVRDWAGNNSSFDGPPFAKSTLFSRRLDTKVVDVRGYPLLQPAVVGVPALIGVTPGSTRGTQSLFAGTATEQRVFTSKTGYGSLPSAVLGLAGDRLLLDLLPSPVNALQNGGFEDTTSQGWQFNGDAVQITSTARNHGENGLILGRGAIWQKESFPLGLQVLADNFGNQPTLKSASGGRLVFAYIAGNSSPSATDRTIFYAHRTDGGGWPATAVPLLSPSPGLQYMDVSMDMQGGLHAAWSQTESGMTDVRYCYKRSDIQQCESSINITDVPGNKVRDARNVSVKLDKDGGVHVVWVDYGDFGFWYASKPVNGSWSRPVRIGRRTSTMDSIAWDIDARGVVHAAWLFFRPHYTDTSQMLIHYATKWPGQEWTVPEILWESSGADPSFGPHLAVSDDGTVHIIAAAYPNPAYLIKRPNDAWAREMLPIAGKVFWISVDRQNTLHVGIQPHMPFVNSQYLLKTTDGEWITQGQYPSQNTFLTALNPTGGLSAIGLDNNAPVFITQLVSTTPNTNTVTQVFASPAVMHKPTLAFAAKLSPPAGNAGELSLQLTDGQKMVSLSKLVADSGRWELITQDMEDWHGLPITMTLSWTQRAGSLPTRLYLDDVVMGEWLTPILSSSTPSKLPAGYSRATLLLQGINFIQNLSVKIGSTTMNDVQRLSDTMIEIALPDGLPVGIYDVAVINPGGQDAVLFGALQIGERSVLPLLLH